MARRTRRRARPIGLGGVLLFVALAMGVVVALTLGYRELVGPDPSAPPPPPDGPATVSQPVGDPGSVPGGYDPPVPGDSPSPPLGDPPDSRPPEPAVAGPPPAPSAPDGQAYVAVVIDDLGRSIADVRRLEAMGVDLSYAVLPFETRTREVVAELGRFGAEVLLHLPMEGSPGADPGPGALRREMSDRELASRTVEALAAVPGARGVNNHMGSVLSADERAMRAVLGVLAERGLFFLDSRTSPATVAYASAAALGLAAAERQVFLDPDPSPEAIRGQFHRLLGLARQRGAAIAIGHPYRSTMDVLDEEIPRARSLGYTFVPVSDLLDRPGGLGP